MGQSRCSNGRRIQGKLRPARALATRREPTMTIVARVATSTGLANSLVRLGFHLNSGDSMAKARRTTDRSSAGSQLPAVRDAKGRFKDIQTHKRAPAPT
jgi:hypothetical protein